MINDLINILSFEFIQKAIFGGALLAVIAPIFGNYLLSTKTSHYGDGISHVSLLGVLIATVFGFNVSLISIIISISASITIKYLYDRFKIQSDATLIVLLVFSLSLISILNQYARVNLETLLFGSLLNISNNDLYTIGFVTILILGLFIYFYKHIINSILFGKLAKLSGANNIITSYGIIAMLGLFVSVSISIFGALLISGIMIIPPLIAKSLNLNLKNTFIASSVIGVLGLFLGLLFSIIFDIPAGSGINLTLIFLMLISLFYRPE